MNKRNPSIRAGLRAVVMLQVVICVAVFAFMSVSKLAEAYNVYTQNTLQSAALFCADAFAVIDSAVEVSKFPGRISNTASPQTFIAAALKKTGIQTNFDFCSAFYSACKNMMLQYPTLDTMAVYENDGAAVYVRRSRDIYYVGKSGVGDPWLQDAAKKRGAATVIAPAQLEENGFGALYKDCIVVTRGIFDPWKLKTLGVFVVAVAANRLENAFQGMRAQNNQQFVLYYDGQPLLTGFDAEYAGPLADLGLRQSVTRLNTQDGTPYLDILYRYDDRSALVIRTPLSAVTSTVLEINLLMLGVLSVTLAFFILLIGKLFQSVLAPLNRLTSAFDQTTGISFPTVSFDQLPSDLTPMFTAYNRMSERIDLLVNEGLRKDMAQRETELQLLRTQINPHYLYNTLECIHMRAYTNSDYEVARMAELLGSNLQYGLRDTTRKVTLRTELEKAQEYMMMLSYHYGNRVHLSVHVDKAVLDCQMIKLLLQPIIENAVQHGLKPDAPLSIELLGYRAEDEIILKVTDDGAGIAPDALAALQRELDGSETDNAIGLKNVHRRLRLNYGDRFGVHILSVPGQSTVVSLNLPFEC